MTVSMYKEAGRALPAISVAPWALEKCGFRLFQRGSAELARQGAGTLQRRMEIEWHDMKCKRKDVKQKTLN